MIKENTSDIIPEEYRRFEAWLLPYLRENQYDIPEEHREFTMEFGLFMAREAWKQSKKSHDPLLSDILDWFKAAKPKPEQKDISVQLGCHIEEIAEMFEAIMRGSNLGKHLANNAQNFKACESANLKAVELIRESKSRQVELLDALCDQIVTALGVGYMMGFDIDKALSEVNRSNWSKFVDGQPVFDDNGKIKKGGSYTPPDLKPYINQD